MRRSHAYPAAAFGLFIRLTQQVALFARPISAGGPGRRRELRQRRTTPMFASEELRELIERAKGQDPTAISELYGRYAAMVLRYIHLRVAELELAQDLTQEVFIKVINGIERFEYRDEKAFLGWLYTIAANVLSSHQRRRRVLSTPFDTRDDLVDQRSQDDARAITERVAIRQALGQLTPDQQQVVALRFFADMSNSEIAGLLRRTEGAVKAIQHRALQSLQKILNREAEEVAAPAAPPPPPESGFRRPIALAVREVGAPRVMAERPARPLESGVGD
jgi:RNA polymerase sigma-70 factor (ECF subfamily)